MPADHPQSRLARAIRPWTEAPRLWLLFALFGVFSIMPFALVRFPPINDYPFHLARIVILSQLDNPLISRFYARGSFLLPNVALDAFSTPLTKVLGAESAVRLFVELTLLTMFFGAALLHARAHRRWSVWPLLVFSLLHNGIFRFGFFNYLFGVGLAFVAGSAWLSLPRGYYRLALSFAAATILMFCHLEAFGVFAILVAGEELSCALREWRSRPIWITLGRLLASASPLLLTLGLFFLVSPTAKMAGVPAQFASGLKFKPFSGLFSLWSGIIWLDIVTAATLLALIGGLTWFRRLELARPLAFAALLTLITFLVLPDAIMGGLYADSRLGPALAILILLSVDLRADASRRLKWTVVAIALMLAGVRTTALGWNWFREDRQIAQIVSSLDRLEPGATLFAVTYQPYTRMIADTTEKREAWQPPLKHVASYAVLHAPVFVPMTWTNPTQQPLILAKEFEGVQQFQGTNPTRVNTPGELNSFLALLDRHLNDGKWPDLDPVYVLVIDPKGAPDAGLPNAFGIVARGDKFVLLKSRDRRKSGG